MQNFLLAIEDKTAPRKSFLKRKDLSPSKSVKKQKNRIALLFRERATVFAKNDKFGCHFS